jgi:hypothetical protein
MLSGAVSTAGLLPSVHGASRRAPRTVACRSSVRSPTIVPAIGLLPNSQFHNSCPEPNSTLSWWLVSTVTQFRPASVRHWLNTSGVRHLELQWRRVVRQCVEAGDDNLQRGDEDLRGVGEACVGGLDVASKHHAKRGASRCRYGIAPWAEHAVVLSTPDLPTAWRTTSSAGALSARTFARLCGHMLQSGL